MASAAERRMEMMRGAADEGAGRTMGAAPPTYLYDGKTFDEWRSLWKNELKTERRIEAIEALAAFARTGYGREAAEAILDVAAEYNFKSFDEGPEGKLKERVTQVLGLGPASPVPATDWLPPLMERLAKDPDKWRRPLSEMLISGFGLDPTKILTIDLPTSKLLLEMAREPKYGPNAEVLSRLHYDSPQGKGDPEVASLIKAALTGEDVANALTMLKSLSFGSLDAWPEQLDLLFHQDASARRTARTLLLRQTSSETRQAVADRLTAVLDDPKRAEDHADAIRALGVAWRAASILGGRFQGWSDEEARKRLTERFEQITREGPPELVVPALVAMGVDLDQWLLEHGASEPAEYQERIKQARDKIEAEVEQLVDPPDPGMGGLGGGGGGGGIF